MLLKNIEKNMCFKTLMKQNQATMMPKKNRYFLLKITILWCSVFFSREHQKCPWTTFFRLCSRALFLRSRAEFLQIFMGTFHRSRALFFGKKLQKKPYLRFWAVPIGSRTLFLETFTGTLEVHGQFLPFQFTGTFSRLTGKKNTAVMPQNIEKPCI